MCPRACPEPILANLSFSSAPLNTNSEHKRRRVCVRAGAYTAWPALATEALCYIEGNCSSAFLAMASFAPNTYQGAFGQANAVPQMQTPPYTPFNDEPVRK